MDNYHNSTGNENFLLGVTTLSKHDQKRKEKAIKTLEKALEQLKTAIVYLTVQEPMPVDEIYKLEDAHEHVCIALEHLGVSVEGGDDSQ